MSKRFLVVGAGVILGLAFTAVAPAPRAGWSWFGNKELDKSSDYVRDILELVNENYVDPNAVDYDKLTSSALHGMIDSLDPHSEFLQAGDYKDIEEEMSGKFGGIGIQVEIRNNRVIVIAPIAGTPGERAGIQRGDEITRIDGKPLDNGSGVTSVVEKLRGAPKSTVQVTILRPSTGATIDLTLTRELIKVATVRDAHVIGGSIGYVQLTEFTEKTADDFAQALGSLREKGATSLILDLRNNPGGLLDSAVKVADPFFKKGELVVYTQGRNPGDRQNYRASGKAPPITMPMVVLINAGSASAAEIVAGALKDTGRAVILGERSFGKGSVQSVFKLKNGEGLRLTTALYYTPGGVSIHQKGIEPNVEVVMSPEEDLKLQTQRLRFELTDPKEFEARFGYAPVADRQLDAAVDLIRGIDVYARRAAAR